MNIEEERKAVTAEINCFKQEALKMHIVQVLADSYTHTNLFDYNLDSDGSVIWYKAQARQLWDFWQAAKAQAVPNTQALHDRLLVKSIREHVESHIAEISVADLFDKGWFAAMKCIQNDIDMLEAQEQSNESN